MSATGTPSTAGPVGTTKSAAGEMQRVFNAAYQGLFGEDDPLVIGDRFVLGNWIGKGGLGTVWRAFDRRLQRDVAIKFVHARARDAADPQRLFREALVLARLSHPNIVPVFDVGRCTHSGDVYIAMELIEGIDLAAWIEAAPRSWRECLAVFDQVALALDAAHRAGLVHGDIKPQNAMIDRHGRVFVLDFGLARETESLPTEPDVDRPRARGVTRIGGTDGFMPPEQYAQQLEPRTDQFAFCASLFHALYRTAPFDVGEQGIDPVALRTQPAERSQRASGVPRWLRAAVLRGLSEAPADRFASMSALRGQLQPPRRRAWPPVVAGSFAAAAAVVWLQGEPERERCRFDDGPLDGVWDASTATELAERAQGVLDTEALDESFAGFAGHWSDYRAKSCAAHAAGEITDTLYEVRLGCLRTARSELAYLVEQFRAPAFENWQLVEPTVRAVTAPRCEDDDALLAGRVATDVDWELSHEIERGIPEANVHLLLHDPARHLDRLLALEAEVAGRATEPAIESWLNYAIGAALNERGRYPDAERRLHPAMLRARRFGRWPEAEVLLLATLAESVAEQPGRAGEALLLAEQAAATMSGNPKADRDRRMEVLRALGLAQFRAHRFAAALVSFEAALVAPLPPSVDAVAERYHTAMRAGSLNMRALSQEALGWNTAALASFREALAELERIGYVDTPLGAQVLNNLGTHLRADGRVSEAIEVLEQAAEVKRRASAPHQAASTTMNLANALIDAGRPDDAMRRYDDALALLAEDPERSTEALLRMNRAMLQHDLGHAREELDEWDRALALLDEHEREYRHMVFVHRARARLELGDRDGAREDLGSAVGVQGVSPSAEDRHLIAELENELDDRTGTSTSTQRR